MIVLLWIFAVLGAVGTIGIVTLVGLEMWAAKMQSEGENPFE